MLNTDDVKVSVALASYNGSRHIAEQLESLLRQTRSPDEIVVSDDRSTDDTVRIVQDFARRSSIRIRVVTNDEPAGVSRNFESALRGCSGDLIFLSDQDDAWYSNKIQTVLDEFVQRRGQVHYLLNDQHITDGELVPSGRTKMDNIRASGPSIEDMITGCCTAVTPELLRICLPFPNVDVAHDVWIGKLAGYLGVRQTIPIDLQSYRRHGQNVSDWEMSRGAGVSRFDLVRKYGLQDACAAWSRDAAVLRAYAKRLSEHRSSDLVTSIDLNGTLAGIAAKSAGLDARADLCSRPRVNRIIPVLSALIAGRYAQFAGPVSAIKDILRA